MMYSAAADLNAASTPNELPVWVEEALRHDSRERFWQFCTCDKDTGTGYASHALLPRRLVAPLEEYLGQHLPLLVNGR
jgi:hypothetical protein